MTDSLSPYRAAQESAMFHLAEDRSWLEVRGNDVRDWLQRLLTSDTSAIEPGQGHWSALVNGRARWIADLLLYGLKDGIALDCPSSQFAALQATLEERHFGEDAHWVAPEDNRLLVLGPKADGLLEGLGFDLPPSDFSLLESPELRLLTRPDRGAPCWECSGPPQRIQSLMTQLREAGAIQGTSRDLETLRIEGQRPKFGIDFDTDSILPESGEWQRASLNKGCYPGQEVIAKVHNFGDAPRQLCQLIFAEAVELTPQTPLQTEDHAQAGTVSSWVLSPELEKTIGIGVVRRKSLEESLFVTAISGQKVTVQISPLKQPLS